MALFLPFARFHPSFKGGGGGGGDGGLLFHRHGQNQKPDSGDGGNRA